MLKNSVGGAAPALRGGARVFAAGSFVVVCSCLASGCDDGHAGHDLYHRGHGYGPAQSPGAIRFEWSLAGSTDAGASDEDAGALMASADAGVSKRSACSAIGATQFQALLLDQGTIVGAFQSRCSAGSDIFRVGSNDYTMTAVLATADGVPVTETKVIPSFIVAPGETQVIHMAFEPRAR